MATQALKKRCSNVKALKEVLLDCLNSGGPGRPYSCQRISSLRAKPGFDDRYLRLNGRVDIVSFLFYLLRRVYKVYSRQFCVVDRLSGNPANPVTERNHSQADCTLHYLILLPPVLT